MSKTLIRDIISLTREGWRPYTAQPQQVVYDRLSCTSKKAYWFVRGELFLCVGCARRCCLARPEGFAPPLPINYAAPPAAFTLSPQEMVQCKASLTVPEVAYCLNISERLVYKMIERGQLIVLRTRPRRIRPQEVIHCMRDYDE